MILEGNYAMNRQKLVSQIRRYVPYNEQEEADKALILNWIEKNDDAFLRDNGQTCSTCQNPCATIPKQMYPGTETM